ncbi:methylmalonyl Co-A mutase-associated GTPase MeaB [Mucilaginibacter paludis]|uniref:LAO/AO transport system ATPase n=1 Tax=Mucilaginibacter paludis DSM 18603 TaxID=714943 RepID=H1Y2T5_9SPHI|nr:methylmalonyl Co-A mutase-associated GTPase MeaB [Mucilaginibacter paludis]EHQ28264.1 LAO/AO transport system ATPase [Mucilaginibacter paludis DSM 18603]
MSDLHQIDFKALARHLTLVENDLPGGLEYLKSLNLNDSIPVIGLTGPPGAGKSTLVNALISQLLTEGKRIAVLAVDPTSPFNHGSLLGDRIRMTSHFNHPDVFIRSVATRGWVGGLSVKAMEMTDVFKAYGFDYIMIETVGVGQSEIDIAGLADVTMVVLVPESGDEIQHIKSGLMEIADVFIVNKADRDPGDGFANNLQKLIHYNQVQVPVFKTVAINNIGIGEILKHLTKAGMHNDEKKLHLLTEKVYHLIQYNKMRGIEKNKLRQVIGEAYLTDGFNIYRFADELTNS